ncbi:calcium-binding mitochondrial carrier protein Aralar1 isoform X3 [Vespula squamosa]|uniref:Calcium-binding mitochondrial carrier protein Aralar1 isoform X3 n=1 Tax=Vespula squamosa TaxID=30214 RepID=A0ABD2AQ98_VESSQ
MYTSNCNFVISTSNKNTAPVALFLSLLDITSQTKARVFAPSSSQLPDVIVLVRFTSSSITRHAPVIVSMSVRSYLSSCDRKENDRTREKNRDRDIDKVRDRDRDRYLGNFYSTKRSSSMTRLVKPVLFDEKWYSILLTTCTRELLPSIRPSLAIGLQGCKLIVLSVERFKETDKVDENDDYSCSYKSRDNFLEIFTFLSEHFTVPDI